MCNWALIRVNLITRFDVCTAYVFWLGNNFLPAQQNKTDMEVLAPLALAALGGAAISGISISTGGRQSGKGVPIGDPVKQPAEDNFGSELVPSSQPLQVPGRFAPIRAQFEANQVPGRSDNLQPLRTVFKDPKYELTPDMDNQFQYDQMNRGETELENQLYYSTLTRPEETPLAMGYLPEYKKSSGVRLRDPDTPDMLKPQKRENMQEDMWISQPEPDRKHYQPITGEQGRRARLESKMAGGNGALDGFYTNDRPGNLGGPTKGWSTGLEPTREFTGYHPRQRFFRKHDNKSKRGEHGLRAMNKQAQQYEVRADMGGFRTSGKKDQVSRYHRIAIADGGRAEPHLPHDMRKVELRRVQRDGPPPPTTKIGERTYGERGK
jgi:hypothetical protein